MGAGGFTTSLIINSVIVYPVTKNILSDHVRLPIFTHRKLLALLFLAVVGLLSASMDLAEIMEDRNLFKVMQVSRTANDKDIRQAYLKLSKELHPDKNRQSNTAQDDFNEMLAAYEILADGKRRQIYDKWGYEGLDWNTNDAMAILYSGLLSVSVSYMTWFALTILLTVQSASTHSRTICIAGLSLIIAADLRMRTSEFWFYIPYFSHVAVYQISRLLFTAYPTFIGGVLVFQNVTYIDPSDRNWKLLSMVYHKQNQFEDALKTLESELRSKSGVMTAAATSSARLPVAVDLPSLPRNLQAKNEHAEVRGPPKRKEIPSWIFLVGFYILFNFVLK